MSEAGTQWHPLQMVGRGLGWGALGGGALGVLIVIPGMTLGALAGTSSTGQITGLIVFAAIAALVAAVIGAVVGAAFGLAGGLALVISGRRAVQRMYRARLVTGGVAAAIPLVSQAWGLHLGGYAGAAVLAVFGAGAAALLTPLVVKGNAR